MCWHSLAFIFTSILFYWSGRTCTASVIRSHRLLKSVLGPEIVLLLVCMCSCKLQSCNHCWNSKRANNSRCWKAWKHGQVCRASFTMWLWSVACSERSCDGKYEKGKCVCMNRTICSIIFVDCKWPVHRGPTDVNARHSANIKKRCHLQKPTTQLLQWIKIWFTLWMEPMHMGLCTHG